MLITDEKIIVSHEMMVRTLQVYDDDTPATKADLEKLTYPLIQMGIDTFYNVKESLL